MSASLAYIGGRLDRGAPCSGEGNHYVYGERMRPRGYQRDTNLTEVGKKANLPPSQYERQSSWLTGLADDFVRLEEQRRRYGQPHRLGRLQVDDQGELRGLLHRQGSRLGA